MTIAGIFVDHDVVERHLGHRLVPARPVECVGDLLQDERIRLDDVALSRPDVHHRGEEDGLARARGARDDDVHGREGEITVRDDGVLRREPHHPRVVRGSGDEVGVARQDSPVTKPAVRRLGGDLPSVAAAHVHPFCRIAQDHDIPAAIGASAARGALLPLSPELLFAGSPVLQGVVRLVREQIIAALRLIRKDETEIRLVRFDAAEREELPFKVLRASSRFEHDLEGLALVVFQDVLLLFPVADEHGLAPAVPDHAQRDVAADERIDHLDVEQRLVLLDDVGDDVLFRVIDDELVRVLFPGHDLPRSVHAVRAHEGDDAAPRKSAPSPLDEDGVVVADVI